MSNISLIVMVPKDRRRRREILKARIRFVSTEPRTMLTVTSTVSSFDLMNTTFSILKIPKVRESAWCQRENARLLWRGAAVVMSRVREDVAGNQNRHTDDTSAWSEATRRMVMDANIFSTMSGGSGRDIGQSS